VDEVFEAALEPDRHPDPAPDVSEPSDAPEEESE